MVETIIDCILGKVMKNHKWIQGRINPTDYWDTAIIKKLNYKREPFNDSEQIKYWKSLNHQPRTGFLYDINERFQPETTRLLINWASTLKNVGINYYKMESGDNLPYHSDTYVKYVNLFNLQNEKHKIWRYIFFVEDWKPGHIFEVNYCAITNWKSGDFVGWNYDTPHLAANLGNDPRFTIQLTGVEI